MTNHYSSKMGAIWKNSRLALLAFFAFLLCGVNSVYAAAGFWNSYSGDLKISKNDEVAYWLYGANDADYCRDQDGRNSNGINSSSVMEKNLETVSSLSIVRPLVQTYANDNTYIDNIVFGYRLKYPTGTYSEVKEWAMRNNQHVTCNWTVGTEGHTEFAADVNINVFETFNISTAGNYTLEFWFVMYGKDNPTPLASLNNGGSNYKINFTVPVFSPSETTMYFGNVPFGESKESKVYFDYNGTKSLEELTTDNNGGIAGVFFKNRTLGYDEQKGKTYLSCTFEPTIDCINQSFNWEPESSTAIKQFIYISDGTNQIEIKLNGSTFTPLITGSKVEGVVQSKVKLDGRITYTGCNEIKEYGVYYSTDPTFYNEETGADLQKCSSESTTTTITSGPVDISEEITDLMSGTTYYYIWYMKDELENVTYDNVMSFTTVGSGYSVLIKSSTSAETKRLGFVKDDNATTGTVDYFVSCNPIETYQLQYWYANADGTHEWVDVPGQTGLINTTSSLTYVSFTGGNLINANNSYSSATLSMSSKDPSNDDYSYVVNFINNQSGEAIKDKECKEVVMTVDSKYAAATPLKVGTSGSLASFPEDSWYEVVCTHKATGAECVIGSGAVPYTSPLIDDEVLTVTYTGGDKAPEFTVSRDLWIKSGFTGEFQTLKNTMTKVECQGKQGNSPMDYVVLSAFTASEIKDGTKFSPFDVMSGTESIKNDQLENEKTKDYGNGYVRYGYDTETNYSSIYLVKQKDDGSGAADLYVEIVKEGNIIDRISLELIGDHLYEAKEVPLADAKTLTIKGKRIYDNEYTDVWSNQPIDVSGSSSASIKYSFKSNCLEITYTGIQFYRGASGDEEAITIDSDNKINICVENTNGSVVPANSYEVVLTDNKTGLRILLAQSNQEIPIGGKVCFKSIDPIADVTNYDISATLKYSGYQVDYAELKVCNRPDDDTIHYTIDNTRTYNDTCSLEFITIGDAMTDLKKDVKYYDATNKVLLRNIVFNVVGGNEAYVGQSDNSVTGGEVLTKVNLLSDINSGSVPEGGYKSFVVRNSKMREKELNPDNTDLDPSVAKPVINHIVIRNSRNVKLQYLDIQGYTNDPTKYDNAIDIDNGSDKWTENSVGAFGNAKIEITNCDISSMGFTCLHVSAYDDILFEGNQITAKIDPEYARVDNLRNWGASLKFIRCKNIKFVRNTFRGQHFTNVWVQECENVLVMNNVFWTENATEFNIQGKCNYVAMIRLLAQTGKNVEVKNIGIYYNTFYISAKNIQEKADILKFGGEVGDQNASMSMYHDIGFNYNNCYSMDGKYCESRSPDPLWQNQEGGGSYNLDVRYNNFWSVKDKEAASSSFLQIESTEETSYHINVPELMCSTANDDPDGLIIRGDGLNKGRLVPDDDDDVLDKSGMLDGLHADYKYADRLHSYLNPIRPTDAGSTDWTLGAYQQSKFGDPIGVIYWNGGQSDDLSSQAWDLRSNWKVKDPETGEFRALHCMDALDEDLIAVIPAPKSTRFPVPSAGIKNYPRIPTNFYNEKGVRDEISNGAYKSGEGVQAGMNDNSATGKDWYFKDVYIEYGGTLMFANYLFDGTTRHYDGASASYVGPRDIWALTGTVIMPFINEENRDYGVRNVISGDYYLNNEPVVYMRYADVVQGQVEWTRSFPNLNINIEPGQQFAVNFPNQYGMFHLTDDEYAAATGKTQFINHGDSALIFDFYGRFAAEGSLPKYTGLESNEYNLLNNYLPANLSAPKILDYLKQTYGEEGTDVKYYVVTEGNEMGSFVSVTDQTVAKGDSLIYPKAGFLVKANGLENLQITGDMVNNSHTMIYSLRNKQVMNPYVMVAANNNGTGYGSRVTVEVNPDVNEYNFEVFAKDKLFNGTKDMSYVPDVYIMLDDSDDEVVAVPNAEKVIPLGVRVREKMDLNFYVYDLDGINEVMLEDRATGEFSDIVNYRAMFRNMEAGDYKGRFYLHLSSASEDDPIAPEDPDAGSDTPTSVDDNHYEGCIDIYNSGNVVTVSSSQDILLAEVYITDMSGRTKRYAASGNYLRLVTDLVPGVYVVNAIGDKASAEQKIVVK